MRISHLSGVIALACVALAGCGAAPKSQPVSAGPGSGASPSPSGGQDQELAGGKKDKGSVTLGEQDAEQVETMESEEPEDSGATDSGAGQGGSDPEETFTIVITKKGDTMVNGKTVSKDSLRAILEEKYKANPSAKIVIQADSDAHYGKVTEIMETAQDVGFSSIGISVQGK